MNETIKIVVAGSIGLAVAALGHHRHQHHHHGQTHGTGGPGCGGHHHGHPDHLHGRAWQGLTESEARSKLAERLDDPAAVDAAIDELDTRGYLVSS